jgi:pyroglutamyl-peptidase
MPDILVTGFEPFGGEATNPSWQAVSALPDSIGGAHVHKLEVPVVFGASGDVVVEAMRDLDPTVVLLVGQAAGRAGLTVERVAINVADATATDNAGVAPSDAPLVEGGPAAYLATIPLKACVASARAAGVPASVSNSAGTYVCNQLMYRALHEQATQGKAGAMAGFVHVPLSCAQALDKSAVPSLPVPAMTEGLLAIIHGCIASHRA